MDVAVRDLQAQVYELQQRLILTETTNERLAHLVDEGRTEVKKLEAMTQEARTDRGSNNWQLVDFKTLTPEVFANKPDQSYKLWSKKVKAFTNAKLTGFRTALETAERETTTIDEDNTESYVSHPQPVAPFSTRSVHCCSSMRVACLMKAA